MKSALPFFILFFLFSCSKKDAADTTPPEITINSPTPNQQFALGDRIVFNVTVSDNVQIQTLKLRLIDSLLYHIDSETLQTQDITVNKKDYQLSGYKDIGVQFKTVWKYTFIATDQSGNVTEKNVSVLVNH